MKTAQLIKEIKFDQKGLIPAIVQDAQSKKVLMVAFMNSLAIKKTLETKRTHFWSRSRKKMWMKGELSGHVQIVKRVSLDCDNDTLLVEVRQVSAACHSGHYSCFYKRVSLKTASVKEIGKKMFDPKKVYKK